jgi:hypothetical protein
VAIIGAAAVHTGEGKGLRPGRAAGSGVARLARAATGPERSLSRHHTLWLPLPASTAWCAGARGKARGSFTVGSDDAGPRLGTKETRP